MTARRTPADRLAVSTHARVRWIQRVGKVDVAASIDAFLRGGRVRTRPKARWIGAKPGLTFVRNALLPGVEALVENGTVLTFVVDAERLGRASLALPAGSRAILEADA